MLCFTATVATELEVRVFDTREAFADWLARERDASPGLWLKIAKKDAGVVTVGYAEAVEVALCHGWIDGQRKALDDRYWLQRFTPRSARSRWSRINRDKVAELIARGEMRPAGLREVERAKADGRWEAAYEGQRTAAVPPDLAEALAANPAASEFFETLSGANRYAILYRLQDAKRAETRARRITLYVEMLEQHRTFH